MLNYAPAVGETLLEWQMEAGNVIIVAVTLIVRYVHNESFTFVDTFGESV